MTDKLTKDEALERYDNLCENALQSIDALLVKMLGVEAAIEDMAGTDMPQRFINLVQPELHVEIIALWNVREEICGNSAFLEIIPDSDPETVWKAMGTAPIDGSEILLLCPWKTPEGRDYRKVHLGSYDQEYLRWYEYDNFLSNPIGWLPEPDSSGSVEVSQ